MSGVLDSAAADSVFEIHVTPLQLRQRLTFLAVVTEHRDGSQKDPAKPARTNEASDKHLHESMVPLSSDHATFDDDLRIEGPLAAEYVPFTFGPARARAFRGQAPPDQGAGPGAPPRVPCPQDPRTPRPGAFDMVAIGALSQ